MKKLLLTLGIVGGMLASAVGQGTINPLNNALTRIRWDSNGNGQSDQTDRAVRQDEGVYFDLFWGATGEIPSHFIGTMTIGSSDGILVGLPSILALPDAGEGGTVISLRVRARYQDICVACSEVVEVTLEPAGEPGAVIWGTQGRSDHIGPFLLSRGEIVCPVPEPGAIALGALAGALLCIRKFSKSK